MKVLWESESFIDDNTLTVNVTRLRKRLESIGLTDFIKTKKGIGYIILEDFDCNIISDKKWIAFVIEQILSNALKYTNKGSISIYIWIKNLKKHL